MGPAKFCDFGGRMIVLREKLLTKIDVAQSLKTQKDDEYNQLNRAFLESNSNEDLAKVPQNLAGRIAQF